MASTSGKTTITKQVWSFAEDAIKNIRQLTLLVEQGPSTSTGATQGGKQSRSETPFIHQMQPVGRALSELQRRFPTVSRGRAANRDRVSGRGRSLSSNWRPYPIVTNRERSSIGRPCASDTVTKEVVIVEYGREKTPSIREKADLEGSGRIKK